jgi:hypothetical protein
MTDQELRALVRDAVARHLGPREGGTPLPPPGAAAPAARLAPAAFHASHAVYLTIVNTDEACVIEPAVPCSHCNYCRSHGH